MTTRVDADVSALRQAIEISRRDEAELADRIAAVERRFVTARAVGLAADPLRGERDALEAALVRLREARHETERQVYGHDLEWCEREIRAAIGELQSQARFVVGRLARIDLAPVRRVVSRFQALDAERESLLRAMGRPMFQGPAVGELLELLGLVERLGPLVDAVLSAARAAGL